MSFTVTRAPLRISCFGGGSDIPGFIEKAGFGQVLSFTIDKYITIAVNRVEGNKTIKLSYSEVEEVTDPHELKHNIVREIFTRSNLGMGWEISSFGDVPGGTGMGSSSAFTVALLQALSNLSPEFRTRHDLIDKAMIANKACEIEIDWCKSPIGFQDQYASAVGGFNFFDFYQNPYGNIDVGATSLVMPDKLKSKLMLFYTGGTRSANRVLSRQLFTDEETVQYISLIRDMVPLAMSAIEDEDYSFIGEELNNAWNIKRKLSGVTNPRIDAMYDLAIQSGAVGGKLLGAGYIGYLLFFVPEENQDFVKTALQNEGLRYTPFNVSYSGVETLVNQK